MKLVKDNTKAIWKTGFLSLYHPEQLLLLKF